MADNTSIQKRLNELGASPPLVVDGVFGPASRAATMQFQKSKGLAVDGKVGPMTLAALGLSGTSSAQAPPSSSPNVSPPDPNIPAGELTNQLTPLSPAQAAQAISDGYLLVTGKRPNKTILGLLLGQTALETGNWQSIHRYNFGNKKSSAGDRNWQFFRCSEIINGTEQFFDPPDPHCKFAAYRNAAEGAAAYIRLLQSRAHWWNGLQSGTVDGFIRGLTTVPAYFTANATQYRNILSDRMLNYTALAQQYAGTVIGSAGILFVSGLVYIAYRLWRRG